MFLNLLDKHFHKEHKLNKIFNRNSVKVSHSCTRNIEHIIRNHNSKITESYIEKSAEASCNCKEKNKCPLEGNCLIKNIVYMATVETETNISGRATDEDRRCGRKFWKLYIFYWIKVILKLLFAVSFSDLFITIRSVFRKSLSTFYVSLYIYICIYL